MFKMLIVLMASLCVSGCVGIYALMIGADEILVFDNPPDQKYVIMTTLFGQDEDINDAIREIKIKAKRLKADAIILQQNQPNNNPQYSGSNNQIVQVNQNQSINFAGENSEVIVKATAIKFR